MFGPGVPGCNDCYEYEGRLLCSMNCYYPPSAAGGEDTGLGSSTPTKTAGREQPAKRAGTKRSTRRHDGAKE